MNKLKIDSSLCIGCGACVAFAPGIFGLNENSGKAKVISQPKKINNQTKTAINSCPVNAIKIIKEEK